MHFFAALVSFLTLTVVGTLAAPQPQTDSVESVDTTSATITTATNSRVCNPRASGSNLQTLQQQALADFAYLFLTRRDAKAAFDKYIPGCVFQSSNKWTSLLTLHISRQYIQHSPAVAESGRDVALAFLVPSLQSPGFSSSNLKTFAGQGLGIMHYRMNLNGGLGATDGVSLAVADIFRFKGTCIIEHWDVLQQITGTELNPIAFF